MERCNITRNELRGACFSSARKSIHATQLKKRYFARIMKITENIKRGATAQWKKFIHISKINTTFEVFPEVAQNIGTLEVLEACVRQ